MLKQSTLNRLDRSAVNLATFIEGCLKGLGGTRHSEKGKTFRQEIKHTVSYTANRHCMSRLCEGDVENICKSKAQIEYLTDATISRLIEAGIKIPE